MEINNLKVNQAHVDKLVSIIERFYETDHVSDSGTTYTFTNKPNIQRVRFLLEGMVNNQTEDFSVFDKNELLSIFSWDIFKYIQEFMTLNSMINEDKAFLKFLQDFFKKMHSLEQDAIKWDLLRIVKNCLDTVLQEPIDTAKKQIEKWWLCKVISVVGKSDAPILLIQSTKKWELFLIDAKSNQIVKDCWDALEKKYAFSGQKLFIFNKITSRNKEKLSKLAEEMNIKNSNATIKDFLVALKNTYGIHQDVINIHIAEREELMQQNLDIAIESKQIIPALIEIFQIVNFLPKRKEIVISNTEWEIIDLWSYEAYTAPTKIPAWYKNKDGIKIPVTEKGTNKIIVTNGEKYDIFDME